jgi:hypothetical protein
MQHKNMMNRDSRAGHGRNAGLGCCQRIQSEACLQASSDKRNLEVRRYNEMQNNINNGRCSLRPAFRPAVIRATYSCDN